MSDNVLDLPPRGPARHCAILTAREQYIDDSLRRAGDSVLIDGDGMQAAVAKIIGDEVSADDLKAAVQWWNAELQKQFQERYDMPSVALAEQIEKYKTALERSPKALRDCSFAITLRCRSRPRTATRTFLTCAGSASSRRKPS